MNQSTGPRSLATMAVALVGVAALGAAAVVIATTSPQANASGGFDPWADDVALLDTARDSADVIPDTYSVDSGLRLSSQYLGEDRSASYWVGVSTDDNICVIVGFAGKMQIAAVGCATADEFAAHGAAIQANTVDGATVAYLLPDAFAAADAPGSLSRVHPNLIVGDPFTAGLKATTLTAADGSVLTLRGFGEVGGFGDDGK